MFYRKLNIKQNFATNINVSGIIDYIKKNPIKVKITSLICIVLLTLIVIGASIYHNSDSYKIKKASKLIASGQYLEGLNKIYDVYTPQAIVIKNFVEVENKKQNFVDVIDSGSIEDAFVAYDEFEITINEFEERNEVYFLPDDLRKNYDCYRIAFDYIGEYTEASEDSPNEMVQALYDVQCVMMNEVYKNNSSKGGETFTINELQSRVNTTKSALGILGEYDFSIVKINDSKVELYCHTDDSCSNEEGNSVIWTSSFFYDTINTMISECEYEVTSNLIYINRLSKKFKSDADLYKNQPTDDYSSYVGENLENIRDYGSISNNRETILKILRKDMLYYLIVGTSADQNN